ncbi:alpha/beta hydrolase [Aquincola sp. S2]|uniref:Alpha/beta hydrolase n=1 Tax=Pseudaquabacterium terrae TaxID=2732868 RepID=A0ABX2ENZ3_9BURK|nr:alpha/beta hydrolase [Aquabacterium terrae]NRF70282.1 alpha/beta hydrolase [Aquabacterium terrae]
MSSHLRSLAFAGLLIGPLLAAALLPAQARPSVPPTVEHDATLPRVELGGYAFHAEHFGQPDKPVLIVLHGGPGADYRYLLGLKALADDYQVVFYDQRGTGLSPRVPAGSITVQRFIDDLDAFVETFGRGRPVHLLGHSWGAMLASAYTGSHPAKVSRLILAEPAFLDTSTAGVFSAGGMPPLRVMWGFAAAWIGKWFVRTEGDAYARDDWFLLQVLPLTQGADEMCDGGLPAMQAWRFGSSNFQATVGRMMDDPAFARQLDFRKGVDAFQGPTLFLAGGCNRVVGEAHQRKLIGHFAQARLEVIPQAGHFMFNDQPERCLAAVRAFLKQP